MRVPTELRRLVSGSPTTLFYGPAAAGKTNILISLAREFCVFGKRCVFISTEGTLHYDKIARAGVGFGNVEFADVVDFDVFTELLLKLSSATVFNYIFIDSINALYRPLATRPDVLSKYLFTLAKLYNYSLRGGRVVASAQVRVGEDGELEASGFKLLDYYFDTIFQVNFEGSKRFIRLEKPPNRELKMYFRVGDEGAVFY
ncbi:hypothetical protein [Thermogladius sp.]|uniref:hypothetical protein n=1 Tax=Thermogladius sp. TaxID=2023064 RepID=UPI003D0AF6E8